MKYCNISTSASVSPLSAADPDSAIFKLLGMSPRPAPKPRPPTPQSAQTIGSRTATATLPAPANDAATMFNIPDTNAARLAEVERVVPLKVINFGTSNTGQSGKSPTYDTDANELRLEERRQQLIDESKLDHFAAPRFPKGKTMGGGKPQGNGGADKPRIDNESKEILSYISEDFVMLAKAGAVVAYHIQSGDELGKEGFKVYCAKHYGEIVLLSTDKDGSQVQSRVASADIWWAWNDPSRRVVRRIVMEPTAKPENDDNPEVFNRWHQLKLTMADPDLAATTDDVGILLRHLLYLSGDDVVGVEFFLNWLAQLYQTPEIKMPTAVLLYSKAGRVGKNLMQRLLTKVFGKPLVGGCTGKQLQLSLIHI